MDRAVFVRNFGGVVEDSPWIAERAFDTGLGPSDDSASGLCAKFVKVFRGATRHERHAVLCAHPDLAGKLAQANRLTDASAAEQRGAGLAALTDDELQEFERLNTGYLARFGFPFIVAVKGLDATTILAEFRRRIDQPEDTEFAEACAQVERIAKLRLAEMLPD